MGIIITILAIVVFILILKSDINSEDVDWTIPQDLDEL